MKTKLCSQYQIDGRYYKELPYGYEEAIVKQQKLDIAKKLIEDLHPGEEVIFEGPMSWTQSNWGDEMKFLRTESRIESLTRCAQCRNWSGDAYSSVAVCNRRVRMSEIEITPAEDAATSPASRLTEFITCRTDFCSWAVPRE